MPVLRKSKERSAHGPEEDKRQRAEKCPRGGNGVRSPLSNPAEGGSHGLSLSLFVLQIRQRVVARSWAIFASAAPGKALTASQGCLARSSSADHTILPADVVHAVDAFVFIRFCRWAGGSRPRNGGKR